MVHTMINELAIGDSVNGVYLLRSAKKQQSKAGKDYLLATLEDNSGSIRCVAWNLSGEMDAEIGLPVLASGKVEEYQGGPQISLISLDPAPANEVILPQILPMAPISPEILYHRVRTAISVIDDSDYRKLCETIYDENRDAILYAPASVKSHHAYLGGYLMHISSMLSTANFAAAQYKCVNRSLLISAVLLHDIGKLRGYRFSTYGYAIGYTEQGRLLGHPAMGSRMISEAALKLGLSNEKILPLQNAVLHHHNNGDRAQEHCLEGKMLQMIDVLDSCALAGGPPAGRTNVA